MSSTKQENPLGNAAEAVNMCLVMIKLLGTVEILLLLLGIQCPASQEGTSSAKLRSSESIMSSYGVPVLSGLTHLCQERVYPDREDTNRHITWDAFSSSLEPSEVISFFRKKLGEAGFIPKGDGGTWRFPVGSEFPEKVLTVLPVKEEGPHSNCKKHISPGAKSILILSRTR